MTKPKKNVSAKKPKEKKQIQGYEMESKIRAEQPRNWVRLAMTDRNNVGVDVYGLVKVIRGDVVAMAEVHQQSRELVGKRVITLSQAIAESLSIKDGKKVVVQRPTEDEIEQYRENIAQETEQQAVREEHEQVAENTNQE